MKSRLVILPLLSALVLGACANMSETQRNTAIGAGIGALGGAVISKSTGGNQTGPKSGQVRLELQADCYAGAFFANTIKDPNSPIEKVTQDDLDRIVEAARAVGDDHIQKQSTGRVVPESWTHGSSAMRQYWTAVGFQSGDPNKCDTFSTDELGG